MKKINRLKVLGFGLGLTALSVQASQTIPLVITDYQAFQFLGHDCGGIKKYGSASGFESGQPTGRVIATTKCSTGGRGSGGTTYTIVLNVTWDLSGQVTSISSVSDTDDSSPVFNFEGYTETTNPGYWPSLNYGYSELITP
jgi:hypothetical protein